MKSEIEKQEIDEKVNISEDLSVIEGELLEISTDEELAGFGAEETKLSENKNAEISLSEEVQENAVYENSRLYLHNIFLPLILLTVSLLGGLRISIDADEFVFWKPALIYLVFGAILLVLFFRSGLIRLDGWLNEKYSITKNVVNGLILVTLFSASTQVFNSLIPEQGLPFWIVGFCFFWTLWTNLFAEFDTRRLLQSLGGLFGLAFVVKYLVLSNLTTAKGSFLERLWENPTQEFLAYVIDAPRFSGATGYIQFFTLVLFLIGLFLIKPSSVDDLGTK